MKKRLIAVIIFLVVFTVPVPDLFAKKKGGGVLRRLKRVGDNIALQEQVWKREAENYKKADEFISSQDIGKGLSSDFILDRCGEPVAQAQDGAKWVYKPPSSSFFKGEKIYFIFDEENRLLSWEQVYQK